jgi:putative transposase
MARQARIVLPGVAHHVTQRGNDQQKVFFTESDRRLYLSYLRQSAELYGLRVFAYCLMTNHVHLIVVPLTEDALSKSIGRTHLMYAQHVHDLHKRVGHFWQNRFYSCPIDGTHSWQAAAYVELNPVRAGLVRDAWEHPWSSARVHCYEEDDPSGVLSVRDWFKLMPAAQWRATLTALAGSDPLEGQIAVHTRSGRPMGDPAFLDRLEARLGRGVRKPRMGRPKGSKKRNESDTA